MICHNAEWNYADCCIFFSFMLSVIVLSVVMLNVVMLSVVAPVQGAALRMDHHSQPYHETLV
jgi:hypothetical protein